MMQVVLIVKSVTSNVPLVLIIKHVILVKIQIIEIFLNVTVKQDMKKLWMEIDVS